MQFVPFLSAFRMAVILFVYQVNSPVLLRLRSRNAQIPSALVSHEMGEKERIHYWGLTCSGLSKFFFPVNNSIEQNFMQESCLMLGATVPKV